MEGTAERDLRSGLIFNLNNSKLCVCVVVVVVEGGGVSFTIAFNSSIHVYILTIRYFCKTKIDGMNQYTLQIAENEMKVFRKRRGGGKASWSLIPRGWRELG